MNYSKPQIHIPEQTIQLIKNSKSRIVAEIGIIDGNTSCRIASILPHDGCLHLFDFESHVNRVVSRLNSLGYTNFVGHANSARSKDNYNWSLMKLLKQHSYPIYDYVYLDGAHTWQIDALSFFLVDRLLKPGGFLDFDDYAWSLEKSPTMNPRVRPQTSQEYTAEQIKECHIGLIVDLLVKRDNRYLEVSKNKIYKKIS